MQLSRLFIAKVFFGLALAPIPAACSPAAPEPEPAPVAALPQDDDGAWMDVEQTPGDWTYVSGTDETAAVFSSGEGTEEPQLMVICDVPARRVSISRVGQADSAVQMTVRTETQTSTISAEPAMSVVPLLRAQLHASDPLLEAIAFSKGRFAVEAGGTEAIYVPAYPEITRVVEDCRG